MFRKITVWLLAIAALGNAAEPVTSSSNQDGRSSADFSYCGEKLPESRTRVKRVIGGRKASAHTWPWQVLILNGSSQFCSGSIISPTWLLTSAHCMDSVYDRVIYVGRHWVNETDKHEQKLEIEEEHIHPKYVRGNDTHPGDNDMALIKLKQPISFTRYVRAVCLPNKSRSFHAGHQCVLSGWGVTNATTAKTSNVLRQVNLPLVSQRLCNSEESYGGKIGRRYFCAGVREGGKDGCNFDSGGPLVCAHDSKTWFLVGMMSWGEGCAQPKKYGVYLNITEMMLFIKGKVKDLPQPHSSAGDAKTSESGIKTNNDERKERLFVAIICALCVIIVILLTTLCIVHFYTKGYICCTATHKTPRQPLAASKSPKLLETNGKLNKEVTV